MSLSLRRGALATAAVIAFVPLAAGCGAGFNAGSEKVVPDNSAGSIGQLQLLDVSLVLDQSAHEALVTGTVANNGDGTDRLESLSAAGHQARLAAAAPAAATGSTTGATLTAAHPATTVATLPVPGQEVLRLGSAGMATATVPSTGLSAGRFVPVTFTFADAGTTTIEALVENSTGVYQGVTPPPTPKPTPTTCATPSAPATGRATSDSTPTDTSASTPAGDATATSDATPGATPSGTADTAKSSTCASSKPTGSATPSAPATAGSTPSS